MTTPAVVAPDLVALAEKFADVTVDTRGRKSFDFDDHGIAAFAAALAPAQTQGDAKPVAYPDADLSCGLSYDGMLVCGSPDAIRRVRNWLHMTTDVVPTIRAELMNAREQIAALAAPRAVPESLAPTQPSDEAEADAFDQLCREHDIYATAAARQCEVFWRAGAQFALATPAPTQPSDWSSAAEWIRNNYQDHPNIASLCEAMLAAAPAAAEVERKPLTDEQIVILRRETLLEAHQSRASDLAFARAIEAAAVPAPVDARPLTMSMFATRADLEAAKAARAALPQSPRAAEPKPIAKIHSDGYWTRMNDWKQPVNFASVEVYAAPPAAQPACSKCYGHRFVEEGDPETGGNMVPCACNDLAQPDAKDTALTDEQILDVASHFGFIGNREQLIKFTRAAIAAAQEAQQS